MILKGAEIMKRFVCLLLILCIIPVYALMESIDLSGYSFDDLRKLQQDINAEIKSRPEWKSVPVPSGVYIVGEDIPEGKYSVKLGESESFQIEVNRGKDMMIYQTVKDTETEFGCINLQSGDVVEIRFGVALFAPADALGF